MTSEFKRGMSSVKCEHFTTLIFSLASELVDNVMAGKAVWADLFAKHDFFHKYRYYLQIVVSTAESDTRLKWYVTS